VIHGHEDCVDDYTDSYEHVDEAVGDEQFDVLRKYVPTTTTLPAKQEVPHLCLEPLLPGQHWLGDYCTVALVTQNYYDCNQLAEFIYNQIGEK